MASKVTSNQTFSIKGILSVDDGRIMIEVEDHEDLFNPADFVAHMEGKDVTVTIKNVEELA